MTRKNQSFWYKMAALSMVLVSESISATLILPFVGLFVAHLHNISADEAGYLSGILVSVFQLGQMLTAKMWGRMSDRFGRKPMIQIGLCFNAVAAAFFGISPSIEFCILMRFLHGCANGNVLVAKTVIADITDKTTEGLGFSTISLFWGVGSIIGPTLGGLLYDPGNNSILKEFFATDEQGRNIFILHPAMLPTMVITSISLLALVCTCIFLPETSKNAVDPLLSLCFWRKPITVIFEEEVVEIEVGEKLQEFEDSQFLLSNGENTTTITTTSTSCNNNNNNNNNNNTSSSSNRGGGDSMQRNSSKNSIKTIDDSLQHCTVPIDNLPNTSGMRNRKHELILDEINDNESKVGSNFGYREAFQSPSTRLVLVMYMCIASTECALLEIIPLWSIASVEKGGLDFSSPDVGWLMCAASAVCVIANINFYKISTCVHNNKLLWDFSVILWALTSIATPCGVFFPRKYIFIYVAFVSSMREVGLSWAYALIYLFVARSAPETHVGAMNGIAQSIGSFSRMLTMLTIPPMFAWSLKSGCGFPFNYHFVFWLTNIPLLATYVLSTFLSSFVLSG